MAYTTDQGQMTVTVQNWEVEPQKGTTGMSLTADCSYHAHLFRTKRPLPSELSLGEKPNVLTRDPTHSCSRNTVGT